MLSHGFFYKFSFIIARKKKAKEAPICGGRTINTRENRELDLSPGYDLCLAIYILELGSIS